MEWVVAYHASLDTDWRNGRRTWLTVLTCLLLLLLVHSTRRQVVYVWDALPWLVVGGIIIYLCAIISSLFTNKGVLNGWTRIPRIVRETMIPRCAASYIASLPANTWTDKGSATTLTSDIQHARQVLEWALGEHLARAADYECLLVQLWNLQGLDAKEVKARLRRIKTGKDGSFGMDAVERRLMTTEE